MLSKGNHNNLDSDLLRDGFLLSEGPAIGCTSPPPDLPGFDGGWALDHLEDAERVQLLMWYWRDLAHQASFRDPNQISRGNDMGNYAQYDQTVARDSGNLQKSGCLSGGIQYASELHLST